MKSIHGPLPGTATVHALWDELADIPAAQSDVALMFLMKILSDWLYADNALWKGTTRVAKGSAARSDLQHGWRDRVVRHLHSTPAAERRSRAAQRAQGTDPGMTMRMLTADSGAFRVRRLHDGFVNFAAFRRTAHYRNLYRAPDVVDRMWVVFPVSENAESYFVFDRVRRRRRFSKADAALAGSALRGIKWFHRQLLLSHGLPIASNLLTPAERRVLMQLLGHGTEKDIAAHLSLSPGTVHQYAVAIYAKLGVKGRAALMALWISGAAAAPRGR